MYLLYYRCTDTNTKLISRPYRLMYVFVAAHDRNHVVPGNKRSRALDSFFGLVSPHQQSILFHYLHVFPVLATS